MGDVLSFPHHIHKWLETQYIHYRLYEREQYVRREPIKDAEAERFNDQLLMQFGKKALTQMQEDEASMKHLTSCRIPQASKPVCELLQDQVLTR